MSATDVNSQKTQSCSYRQRYIVIDRPPQLLSDNETWTDWVYHHETQTQTAAPRVVQRIQRISATTPNFNKAGRPPLKDLNFFFSKEEDQVRTGHSRSYRAARRTIQPVDTVEYCDGMFIPISAPTIVQGSTAQDAMIARLSNKLRTKLKGQKINLAQAMAERKQTADLVASTAKSIASAIINLKRGNFAKAARDLGVKVPQRAKKRFSKSFPREQAQAVANGWLALQYGWRPLLNDVYGACELLAEQSVDRIYGKERVSESRTFVVHSKTNLLQNDERGVKSDETRGEEKITVRMGCTFSISAGEVASPASMGIINPAVLAWEVMPWSFVADWFLPVGSWLNQLDATLGLSFETGYTTVFKEMQSSAHRVFGYTNLSTGTTHNALYRATYSKVTCQRTAMTSFPVSHPPQFKNPVSIEHAANAVALLTSLFKR